MATRTLLTVEDFVRLPESVGTQDVRYELVEGELFTMSPGMLPYSLIRDKLLFVLMSFLQDRKLGTVVSEQAFQLSERTVRVPDIALVRAGRQLATDRPIEDAPDLAVEVISPRNSPREIDRRVSDYFAASGCGWFIPSTGRSTFTGSQGSLAARLTSN